MSYWIDTHAHIYLNDFDEDRQDAIARCIDRDVLKIIMPNIDRTSIDAMMEVESRYPQHCFSTIGLHPCSVKQDFGQQLYTVEQWLQRRKFLAIGEIGTDLYWDKTFWDQQQEAFRIQVNWAKQFDLPIIIHCRESLDQTIALVREMHDQNLRGVFHCFGGSVEQAKSVIELGFYLGIGGVSTFKKSGLDRVLPEIGLTNVIFETDSPYLAPVPYRGKRNEPAYIPLIGDRVAEMLEVDVNEVMTTTTQNALRLFNLS